jgi:hypothetical protein
MKVKELIKMLKTLDQNAVIDIASDEEGNSFGDIGEGVAEGILNATGERVYSLYPENSELPEERYSESIGLDGQMH